jgi:endogenous inhibitor of DNA gyrase (YacG/DUF329 family)
MPKPTLITKFSRGSRARRMARALVQRLNRPPLGAWGIASDVLQPSDPAVTQARFNAISRAWPVRLRYPSPEYLDEVLAAMTAKGETPKTVVIAVLFELLLLDGLRLVHRCARCQKWVVDNHTGQPRRFCGAICRDVWWKQEQKRMRHAAAGGAR